MGVDGGWNGGSVSGIDSLRIKCKGEREKNSVAIYERDREKDV